jgi:hypothetical protein
MPTFSGKFQYLNADGTAAQALPCRLTFDKETFTVTLMVGEEHWVELMAVRFP